MDTKIPSAGTFELGCSLVAATIKSDSRGSSIDLREGLLQMWPEINLIPV